MRIFLSGDEDTARFHLPVAQSKVMAFADRCKRAGLSQNTFSFIFKETGTQVFASYGFGQVQMRVHSPVVQVVDVDVEREVQQSCPRTFYMETEGGFFWVEIARDKDGSISVILTPFTATVQNPENPFSFDYIYPGMGHQTAGMCAGVIDDHRYVVTQRAAVFKGECEEKGTIALLPSSENGRITIVSLDGSQHEYLIVSGSNFSREVKHVAITSDPDIEDIVVQLKYAELDSLLAASNANLPASVLQPNPCWVHRKCQGSYFSPNKTIGYHVDIGIDENALGNINSITGGDLLDNDGGAGEALFNHTLDLYRMINLALFPITISGYNIEFLLVSPTMWFEDSQDNPNKCWGGYGIAQNDAGCADYMQDFNSWFLAPRPIIATVNLSSGNTEYRDVGAEATSIYFNAHTWDGQFFAKMQYDREYSCNNVFYKDDEKQESGTPCRFDTECGGNCGVIYDPVGFNGVCPSEVTTWQHIALFFRENLLNTRKVFFCPGGGDPTPNTPQNMNGYYFMFDGFWHLDVGLHWSDQTSTGNVCTLCSVPAAGQEPGELIYFTVGSSVDQAWVAQYGHEYVRNLEIVLPLGYHEMPDATLHYTTRLGFVARVPEHLAAPHDPEIITGGIQFQSPDVDGKIVECERNMMSAPCDCDTEQIVLGAYSNLTLSALTSVYIEGGCPPFLWKTSSGSIFEDSSGEINRGNSFLTSDRALYILSGNCGETVTITDACARQVSISAETSSPIMYGPDVLSPGSTGVYYLDIGTDAILYSGTLEFVSKSGMYFTLRMPSTACGDEYSVTLSGCGIATEMKVRPTLGVWRLIFNGHYGDDGWMDFPAIPGDNQWVDQPFSGALITSTAYHGKYYVSDYAGTYGVTSGIFTEAECEEQFAIYGATAQALSWPTSNIDDFINDRFLNDPDVAFAKIPGFPFVRAAKSWTGRYGYYLFNNLWGRRIYEWVCS